MKLAWLYHDIMDLYGDKGNILTLQARAKAHQIDLQVDTIGIGQKVDLCDYELIFLGGGADREQWALLPDLLSRKDNIQKAMDQGSLFLLICGGYQLFGQYYLTADGTKLEGLGLKNYYTTHSSQRCVGNCIVEANLDGHSFLLVGFENHGGQTKGVQTPLGKVLTGHGNAHYAGFEGYYDGQVLGTYLHGPLLPKNPALADFLLSKASGQPLQNVPLPPFVTEARQALLDRYQIKEKTK